MTLSELYGAGLDGLVSTEEEIKSVKRACDVARGSVLKWMNGTTLPNAKNREAIAKALDVTDDQVLELGRKLLEGGEDQGMWIVEVLKTDGTGGQLYIDEQNMKEVICSLSKILGDKWWKSAHYLEIKQEQL